jgi:hypothetical protein
MASLEASCIWDYHAPLPHRRFCPEGTAFDTPSFCRLQAMILVLHVVVVVVIIVVE